MIGCTHSTRSLAAARARARVRSALSPTLATALLAPWAVAHAAGDPSGHWEGAIHAPSQDVTVTVDLALDKAGKLAGTLTNPGEHISGYPFASASVSGGAVRLEIRTGGSGVQTFAGNVAADGQSMAGDFLIGVYSVPFDLKRTGDAKFASAPSSPAIDAALAGEWNASLDVEGNTLPVVLQLENRADGTSAGSWAAGDGTATPVAIAQQQRGVTLASTVTSASFVGALSADGKEIAGTFSEGTLKQPLTFHRSAGAK